MPHKKRSKLGLPLLLGAITFGLILLALWPHETPTAQMVVAARDLGAGALLTAADLTTITVEAEQAPTDAVSDPSPLVGQSLAVVRFSGEPVTPRHLGPAVAVQPYERAVSLQVKQDQGLAGILRPGMYVGVVATLPDDDGNLFAKTMLEDLRVLYVSPDFQARPDVPITAEMTVSPGQQPANAAPVRSSAGSTVAREGIVIVAAPIDPQPITYVPITETMPITYTLVDGGEQQFEDGVQPESSEPTPATYDDQPNNEDIVAIWEAPVGAPDMLNAETAWVTPVELLAALNAEGQAFTLVLMPDAAEPYVSSGLNLSALVPPPALEEVQP
jgi:Flp pilus assembly protein CpaB